MSGYEDALRAKSPVFARCDKKFVAHQLQSARHVDLVLAYRKRTLALGAYLIRGAKRAEKMAIGVATGMGLIAIAANAVVVPAIANSLSLKAFTADAIKTVDDRSLG